MNTYTITFPFRGEFFFVDITADQIANALFDSIEELTDFIYEDKERYFEKEFYHQGEKFIVTFGYGTTKSLNIFTPESDNTEDFEEGTLVERDIPFLLVKVVDGDKKTIYTLSDNV